MNCQKLALVPAFAALLLSGCSKDKSSTTDPDPSANLNSIEKLIVGSWEYVSSTADTTNYLRPCDIDNTLTFKSDKTYTVDEGSNVCPGNQGGSMSWSVVAHDSTFDFSDNPPTSQFMCKISQIDNQTMTTKVSSINGTATTVYKRK
jgi:hypothetical protein